MREQPRSDGVVFTAVEGHDLIVVVTYKQLGSRWLMCVASQWDPNGLPAFDKTRAMLEAICDSIRGSSLP